MLRPVVALLLVFLVFLQPFGKVMVFVSFKMNQASIAKTLCVKKEIKNNGCQGKCHLKKQLEKETKQEQRSTKNAGKETVDLQFFVSSAALDWAVDADNDKQDFVYTFSIGSSGIRSIFHPPA